MDTGIIWVAVAAIGGSILANIQNWLLSTAMTMKQFWAGVLGGVIAALIWVGAQQWNGGAVTAAWIFTAVIAGWAAVMGTQTFLAKKAAGAATKAAKMKKG